LKEETRVDFSSVFYLPKWGEPSKQREEGEQKKERKNKGTRDNCFKTEREEEIDHTPVSKRWG